MNKENQKIVVVIPTYNEKATIQQLIQKIFDQERLLPNYTLDILVVDDTSPDGTGAVVKSLARSNNKIHLLNGKKEGLGIAYINGYRYALDQLQADIIVGMDADLSHDPDVLPVLVQEIATGKDIAIGSRYTAGGSLPLEWSWLRRLNSSVGNKVARYIGGLRKVRDCTSAYRAINAQLLRKIQLRYIGAKGYVFLVGLLHHALKYDATIKEVPIHFKEREFGQSKLSINDVIEFIKYCFSLRFTLIHPRYQVLAFLGFITAGLVYLFVFFTFSYSLSVVLIIFSTVVLVMGIFNTYLMLYYWEDVERINNNKVPQKYAVPKHSFTAILPARHEKQVIEDTIRAINSIDYDKNLKQLIVVCRYDDVGTIEKVQHVISKLKNEHIQLVTFMDEPINKPHALNVAFPYVSNDVIVIFDAEDQPHEDIYQVVNTVLTEKRNLDVVQSGVQLMNFDSHWFATFNVLEYFFWFKSTLHFFANHGLVPLGGNTVFFRKEIVQEVGGWDEQCLTEDADIGIRLSAAGANFQVVYDEKLATREETPHTIQDFIRQRTRWIQGFLQIFLKGEWLYLDGGRKKLLAFYVLLIPFIQSLTILVIPFMAYTAIAYKLDIYIAVYTFIPLLTLISQMIVLNIGLFEFTRKYELRYPFLSSLKLLLFFFPYQIALSLSALRALYRHAKGFAAWEKTEHINAHRNIKPSREYLFQ